MTSRILLTVLILLVVCPLAGRAQSTTGSLSGAVTDASARGLAGVSIEVVNTGNGTVRSVTSDAHGRYRALSLAPGAYRIHAALPGFVRIEKQGIVVAIGQDVRVDLELQVGAVDTVDVSAEVAAVDLGTTVGGVVTARQIAELPLNGRSFLQLATLQPGVTVSRGTPREFSGGFGATQLSFAGARPEHTAYLLDGTNIADISDKAPSSLAGVLLGVDTVAEFAVQTHGYSAEFGRGAGGIVSAVTRSGTNQLRSAAFAFHRNSALDARSAFDVADPPSFERHQFGGNAGAQEHRHVALGQDGPIAIDDLPQRVGHAA